MLRILQTCVMSSVDKLVEQRFVQLAKRGKHTLIRGHLIERKSTWTLKNPNCLNQVFRRTTVNNTSNVVNSKAVYLISFVVGSSIGIVFGYNRNTIDTALFKRLFKPQKAYSNTNTSNFVSFLPIFQVLFY
jgi:hypothetical protein